MRPIRLEMLLFATAVTLASLGVVYVYSASYPKELERIGLSGGDETPTQAEVSALVIAQQTLMRRQLRWAMFGLLVMVVMLLLPYDALTRRDLLTVATAVVVTCLILVLIPGVGRAAGGSRRWLYFFQPSELAKILLCWALARRLAAKRSDLRYPSEFWTVVAGAAVLLGLVLIEPHLGATVVLAGILGTVLLAAGARWRDLGSLAAVGLLVATVSVSVCGYQADRLKSWVDPIAYSDSEGYQQIHCATALARGWVVGRGLGRSIEKFGYLPECEKDSILAIVGEETGFLGTSLLVFLFSVIAWRGTAIARRAGADGDEFGRLFAIGLTAMIFWQAMLNIGVTCGLLPQTGVGLPFISYGGSSLCASMAAIGLLLNIGMQHPQKFPDPLFPARPAARESIALGRNAR